MSDKYLANLRRQQTRKVMPLIGPLLDAWELLPNDVKTDPQFEPFLKHVEDIYTAMVGNSE